MFYAQINGAGLVVAVTQTGGIVNAPNMVELPSFDTSKIGSTYSGGVFVAPPAPPPDARRWWVDVGPFKDRLGMDAPAIYASTASACRGVVGMLEGRKYINLKDARIAAMLDVLIAAGQPVADATWPGSGPMTSTKRDAIVNTPTTEAERYLKGLSD